MLFKGVHLNGIKFPSVDLERTPNDFIKDTYCIEFRILCRRLYFNHQQSLQQKLHACQGHLM